MQSRTTPDGICLPVAEESSICLVCDNSLRVSTSLNIFYTAMPRNGESLANFVLGVLRLCSSELRSSYICLRCYELFRNLEQAQWTVHNAKCQIFEVFQTKNYDDASKILDGGLQDSIPMDDVQKAFDKELQSSVLTNNVQRVLDESQGSILTNYGSKVLNEELGDSNFTPRDENILGPSKILDEQVRIPISINEGPKTLDEGLHPSVFPSQGEKILHNECFPKIDKLESLGDEISTENVVRSSEREKINYNCDYGKIHEPSGTIDVTYESNTDSKIDPDNFGQKCIPQPLEDDETKSLKNSEPISHPGVKVDSNKIKSPTITWKSGRISKYSKKSLEYNCTTCNKKWRTAAELRTHVKSHSNLRPYMCEKCGQAYKHKHALEIHIGMHNGISPFKCNVCDKLFTQKGALMRHLPMHTGETPYQCELCGKRFVHHTSYNMHVLSHTGKKSYQCHVCDLSLLSTSHLKRHMRVHTGEKPYGCSLCGKSFAERYNLFAHQKIHDPVEIMARAAKKVPFKCEHCDEHFDNKQNFEEHKIQHENGGILTNDRKWIGHTIEIDSTTNNVQEFTNIRDNNAIEESWRNIDYEKFTSPQIEFKSQETDNQMTEESFDILMAQGNYNRTLLNSTSNTENTAIVNQTQI